jgi:hypothetical protein
MRIVTSTVSDYYHNKIVAQAQRLLIVILHLAI